jgi:hypothetical protein
MTDQDKNQLLQDILGDDALDRVRQTSLSRGLQEMRGRRRRVLTARVSLMALPAFLLAVMIFYPLFQPAHQVTASKAMAFASKPESKVESITTEQLFALFPNRQMALVGKPGHQQLIFLDNHPGGDNR